MNSLLRPENLRTEIENALSFAILSPLNLMRIVMTIEIPRFFAESERSMDELASPFLKKHGLNYFQYARVFKDGSTTLLSNRHDFVMARVHKKRRVLSSVNKEQVDMQSYSFLWNGNLPDEDTNMAREHNIDNGLCFVERNLDSYSLIAFGAPVKEKKILDFYINKVGTLKNFILEFSEKAKDLISQSDKNRVYLPKALQDVNQELLFWKKNKSIQFSNANISIHLSYREFECLKFCAQGKTLAEIAAQLNLSVRTVETYLERTKNKVGLSKKSELAMLFRKNFPDYIF